MPSTLLQASPQNASLPHNHLGPSKTMWAHHLLAATVALFVSAGPLLAIDAKLPLLLKEDFEHGASRWTTTDPDPANSVWQIIQTGPKDNHAYRVTGPSKYQPKYRSPFSIAL